MPIGFPAYAEESVRFRGLSRRDLADVAFDALDELGWRPRSDGRDRIRASVPNGFHGIFMTWGANLTIEIDEEEIFVRSEGAIAIAWLDLGQHAANIRKFLDCLEDRLHGDD